MACSPSVRAPPAPPDIEGYLDKLKHKKRFFLSNWTRRWFVVDAATLQLEYFAERTDADKGIVQPSGAISLNEISSVWAFDEYCFQIESPKRTLMLRADSKAQQTCWLRALEKY
ncbi:unnamed protein product, partial [Choristocarpus tenellus]